MRVYDPSSHEWMHGLIDPDPHRRAAALARHRSLIGVRRLGVTDHSLVDLVSAFVDRSGAPRPDLAPFGVLFLQWELRFPDEWRANWTYSPWSAKEVVLRTFVQVGPTPGTAAPLEDLVIAAVRRTQRCQDRWYWRLARRLDSPTLRAELAAASAADDEQTRLRARFVRWLLDHPADRTGSAAWRRWLRAEGRPATHPVAALDLAGMTPAAAAAELVELAPDELAHVLESLHAGPVARILGELRPAVAARAVELMDVRMAARALKATETLAAIAVLEAMDPVAAAARFPGTSNWDLLILMDTGAAAARLRAMPPAEARLRLGYLPREKAMELVRHLPPELADPVLADIWATYPVRRKVRKFGPHG